MQVLSHRAAKLGLSHRPTASKSLHCFKGDSFVLPLHRSVVVIVTNALLVVKPVVTEEILALPVVAANISNRITNMGASFMLELVHHKN